jgi:hypothetical protein
MTTTCVIVTGLVLVGVHTTNVKIDNSKIRMEYGEWWPCYDSRYHSLRILSPELYLLIVMLKISGVFSGERYSY